ncbi:hypothetical protein CHS0354_035311 [Potamilus streckersoni]|uniref:Glycosyl hydrolase family 4 C-terminal domain-containing protein n=1 Tax=Potamilus streckersoni TaxID=2493646 RepID=A0AAE0S3F0_9BIVA|nr:hypothetical protein CHS0354_035311 [Potamilus streckersoni]
MEYPKIAIIGAGSTIFMKNIVGDILHLPAFKHCTISLMDINPVRLEESYNVAQKIALSLNATPKIEKHTHQKQALTDAHFVITMFQVGGYEPATVIDFKIPEQYGLQQTIADTLGIGGIMRAVRTIPALFSVAQNMREVCPKALLMNYVNPMAMLTWAIQEKFPDIAYVGLCHSVQGTIEELARDLDLPVSNIRYKCAGINHVAFYLTLEERLPDNTYRSLYPSLLEGYAAGRIPKPSHWNPRCPNYVRYEMLKQLGYFVTESSEHFSEYTPWFIKKSRPDLIEKYSIPLNEYPKRCIEQIQDWEKTAAEYKKADKIEVKHSKEYASAIVNSCWTGTPSVIYGNVRNDKLIDGLPEGAAVEVPCLVDSNGISPIRIGKMPPQLIAVINSNISVQSLTVRAILDEKREYLYHAAMMDPHTASELDIESIRNLTDDLITAHNQYSYMPAFLKQTA